MDRLTAAKPNLFSIPFGIAARDPRLLRLDDRLRWLAGGGFWSFTFSWCAAAALAIRWLEATAPAGAATWAAILAGAAFLLVGAIALRSLIALRPLLARGPT